MWVKGDGIMRFVHQWQQKRWDGGGEEAMSEMDGTATRVRPLQGRHEGKQTAGSIYPRHQSGDDFTSS